MAAFGNFCFGLCRCVGGRMESIMKRWLSTLLIVLLLCSLPISVSARAYIEDATAVDGEAFTTLTPLAQALENIFAGEIGLYRDRAFTQSVSLPLGISMSVSEQYHVPNGTNVTTGKQCFIYANAVYQTLFGETVGRGTALRYSETVLAGGDSLSFKKLEAAGVRCGAYMRTTEKEDASYDGYSGHSLVILFYDAESITYLEGNADNKGLVRITIESWDEFNAGELRGKGRYLCHIVQPTEERMQALYGNELLTCSLGHTVQTKWQTVLFPTVSQGGKQHIICPDCAEVVASRALPPLKDTAEIFEDISKKDWFYKNDAVNFVYTNGYFNGITATQFAPNTAMTRGMLVTVLGRMSGIDENYVKKNTFTDVKRNKYYAPFVAWACDMGIVNGFEDGSFRPEENVTREQLSKVMALYCGLEKATNQTQFADHEKIAPWAREYVYACKAAGIVNGRPLGESFVFDPIAGATRAEVATILYNIKNRIL